jgi:hypothetical protein
MTNLVINVPPSHDRSRITALLSLGVICLLAGCGGDGRTPVYPVKGRVLVDGKPAARVLLQLHPVGNNSPDAVHPRGEADEQGHFVLTSYVRGDGAPEGEYDVTVTWYRATKKGDEYESVNYLPARYAKATSSKLKATVTRGTNELPVLKLQGR